MGNIFNKFADMFIPKEIAPYLGMIAPMVAPQLGITGSLLLSQAGSWKERGGKWDPYSALATGIALSSPQARAIRRAGRQDPTRGTVGQRLSAGFADTGILGGVDSAAYRAFDPRMSIGEGTFYDGSGNKVKSFWESPSMALDETKQWNTKDGWKDFAKGKTLGDIAKKDMAHINTYGYNYPKTWTGALDYMDKDASMDVDYYKGQKAYAKYEPAGKEITIKDADGNIIGTEQATGTPYSGNLSEAQADAYIKAVDRGGQAGGQSYLKSIGRVDPQHQAGFWEKAGDFGSDLAGAIFPGWYDSYDPVTGKGQGKLNFSNVVQTITVAATLSSVMAIKDELEKEKDLDEAEERKIWKEWFDSYERTSGHTYEFSPYREEHLWEMYQKYMAKGGRVGYNLGGGIMEAPGVPQGMQLDGRDGAFVPQGIEEKADDVPAMLSKNEFVLTADAMRGLDKLMGGQGDPRAAAQHMYQMMDQLEAVA